MLGAVSRWLGWEESNPHIRNQNPLYYHYTIPQGFKVLRLAPFKREKEYYGQRSLTSRLNRENLKPSNYLQVTESTQDDRTL